MGFEQARSIRPNPLSICILQAVLKVNFLSLNKTKSSTPFSVSDLSISEAKTLNDPNLQHDELHFAMINSIIIIIIIIMKYFIIYISIVLATARNPIEINLTNQD
jgi:hypothetical protein